MARSSEANSSQRCEDVRQHDPERDPCGEGSVPRPGPSGAGAARGLPAEPRPQGVCVWRCFVLLGLVFLKERNRLFLLLFSHPGAPTDSRRGVTAVRSGPVRPRSPLPTGGAASLARLQRRACLFGSVSSYSPQAAWASKTRSFHLGGAYWQPAVWFPRKQNLG